MPPIMFSGPGAIIVSAATKTLIESSGLRGVAFRRVIKKRIVSSRWHTWNQDARAPHRYPRGGEPENYILDRPHDPAAARALGPIWEIVVDEAAARIERGDRIKLDASSWNGDDIFRAPGCGCNFITAKARDWLYEHFPDHVAFRVVQTI